MPLWLLAIMAILWGSSKPVPGLRTVKRCRDYGPKTGNRKHLDRLIAEATGEVTGGMVDAEFARHLLRDLAEDCPEIVDYLRQHPYFQDGGAGYMAGLGQRGKHRPEIHLPAGTRHTTYLAEERQRKAETES